MKAIVNRRYGTPEELRLDDIECPDVGENDTLIRVHVAAVNPLDWHMLTGTPHIMRLGTGVRRPKRIVRGVDMAGTVERVGASVTTFAPGDRVFAGARGAFAEYVVVPADAAVAIPEGVDFADAAAMPIAAVTALQGLRDHGKLTAGQSVLINGASGGVGTFAVQIAKALDADVTAVCSAANFELVKSLGADHVVDYTSSNFTSTHRRYEVILDLVGNHPLAACRKILTQTGVYVVVSGPKTGKLLGPVKRTVAAKAKFALASQRAATFTADLTAQDLQTLIDMMQSGILRSVIDRRYPIHDTSDAIRYIEQGHAHGKVLIDVFGSTELI